MFVEKVLEEWNASKTIKFQTKRITKLHQFDNKQDQLHQTIMNAKQLNYISWIIMFLGFIGLSIAIILFLMNSQTQLIIVTANLTLSSTLVGIGIIMKIY